MRVIRVETRLRLTRSGRVRRGQRCARLNWPFRSPTRGVGLRAPKALAAERPPSSLRDEFAASPDGGNTAPENKRLKCEWCISIRAVQLPRH